MKNKIIQVRKKMQKATNYNIEKIKNKMDNYQYISFDLFDTLVKRNISTPCDVFDLVEYEYNKKNNQKISNFRELRMVAENDAYTQSIEPNLDEIYNKLNIQNKEQLKKLEIEIEIEICQKNIDFYPIYEYAKEKNKKIIITSDMYLPKKVVLQILKKAKIDFDYFFLSNEVKLNKRSGKIYPYILENLHINADKLIHIGDSKRSDYLMPRFYGIKSILIPKKIQKLNYFKNYTPRTIEENVLINFLNNNLPMNEGYYYRVGYEVLGIILYGYAKWLNIELNEKKISKTYFLAREGKLLEEAYKIVNLDTKGLKYLYVSRQSTRSCLLAQIDSLEQFFKICIVRKGATLEDFFKYAGLDINEYDALLSKYHVRKTDLVWNAPEMKNIFSNIKKDIQKEANKKEKLLTAYLKQEDLTGKIVISDIGWHGTMQMSLNYWNKQNGNEAQLIGYYRANFENYSSGCEQYGYLYDKRADEYTVKGFIGLFENLFLASHGTTLGYKKEGKRIVPVLAKYEYSKQEDRAFREVQRGALDFVRQITRYNSLNLAVLPELARTGIEKIGLEPTSTDIQMFGKMRLMDTRNLGMVQRNHGLIGYLFNLKDLRNDFLDSSWKIGWLKSVFKLPVSYVKILQVLYKKMDKNN